MKKMILMALAIILMAAPAAQAQKVNKAAILAKLEKSDADAADAKKAAKAATWLNRAKAYYEAATAPTKDIFVGMESMMLKLTAGEPKSVEAATLVGKEYEAWAYPYFTAYIQGGKVVTWVQKREVVANAIPTAIEAYNKAYELDAKQAEKVKAGLKQISDFCSQAGNTGIDAGRYPQAADAYMLAYKAQSSPAYNDADAQFVYYAGYLYTMDGPQNAASYVKGAELLNQALSLGFADEEGSIYYYLFHCYYGQKATDKAYVLKAKDALLVGIEKFPKNERILGALMDLYTVEEGVGDPADLVAMIDKSLAENPQNAELWFGRGRVFYALKNYDESINSFKKVIELQPNMFDGNYYLGVFYTLKGDALNQEVNARQYTSQSAYDTDLKAVNAVYMEAVPCFEKANELKPNDPNTLEFLKSLCFRLRDEAGMMDKYNHYNALFKKAKGLE